LQLIFLQVLLFPSFVSPLAKRRKVLVSGLESNEEEKEEEASKFLSQQ